MSESKKKTEKKAKTKLEKPISKKDGLRVTVNMSAIEDDLSRLTKFRIKVELWDGDDLLSEDSDFLTIKTRG
jgi:hypothetical protein